MSDESQPPPLRLKPRVQAAPAEPSAPETPPPVTSPDSSPSAPTAADAGAPRFRLKPKLSTEASAEAAATPPPTPVEPALAEKPEVPPAAAAPAENPVPQQPEPARPRLKPRLSTEAAAEPGPAVQAASQVPNPPTPPPAIVPPPEPPTVPAAAPEAATDTGRFKLKPKVAAAAQPSPVAAPPPANPEPPALAPESPSVPAPPAAPMPAPVSSGSVPHLNLPPRASVDVTEEIAALASRRPEEKPAFRIGLLAVVVVVAVAVAGGGYFAYKTYLADTSTMDTPAPSKPASPLAKNVSNVVKQAENKAKELSSVPAQLIDKAQDAMAARRGNEQDRIDSALEGRESQGKRAIAARPPDEIAERLAQANNTPAPRPEVVHLDLGTSSTPPSGAPTPALEVAGATVQVSPAFKAFVTNARISGVFQGNPPRALINGRTVRPGDLLDGALGVVFERVDAERKLVFFKDQTGAVVAKKY